MISSPGIGSGLNIDGLIKQLVSAEGDAKTSAFLSQRSSVETKVSAFSKLKNTLADLQHSLSDLKKADAFIASKAVSRDTDIITAKLTGATLTSGTFNIEVQKMAESQRLITTGFASTDTTVGEGKLTIKVGEKAFGVSIDSNSSTVTGIKNAINSAKNNTGVTASILNVDDSNGGTTAKLILTANNTGTDNQITVTVDDTGSNSNNGTGLSALYFDKNDVGNLEQMVEINTAVDAVIVIDNQQVTRSSNTITDAIEGVSLTLHQAKPAEHIAIDLQHDTTKIKKAMAAFVDNFNALAKTVSTLSSYDEKSKKSGALLGDATLLNISLGLYQSLTNNVGSATDAVNNIVDIGITTKADGTLQLDNDVLEEVIKEQLPSLITFFTADDGIAKRLDNKLEGLLKVDGALDAKVDGLNGTIKEVNEGLVRLENRLDTLREQLIKKFTALDTLVAKLRTTSSFLEAQLGTREN